MKRSGIIFFIILLILLSASCDFSLKDSVNREVRRYFEEYTETAGIERYDFLQNDYIKGSDGVIFVPSYSDFSVKFYLRNPQEFDFNNFYKNIYLDFISLQKDKVFDTLGVMPDVSKVKIRQDSKHKSIVILTYPKEFLYSTETGFDISPFIRLIHPVTKVDFGVYDKLKIFCNTPPPPISSACVYLNPNVTPNTYTVCFNMPPCSLLKEIHRDIAVLSINGKEHQIKINQDGSIFFNEPSIKVFSKDKVSVDTEGNVVFNGKKFIKDRSVFSAAGQPAYFETTDKLKGGNTVYKFLLKDRAGLSFSTSAYTNTRQLDSVIITSKSGKIILPGTEEFIEQEKDSSYAAINISASSKEPDVFVIYEIYLGTNENGKLLSIGKGKGNIFVNIPSGNVFIKAYAHKELVADSIVNFYNINVLQNFIYVSENGSDSGLGTKDSPYKTIAKALNMLAVPSFEGNKILLLSDINENVLINNPELKTAFLGGGYSVKGNFECNASAVSFKNLKVEGNIKNTSGEIILQDSIITEDISYSGGQLFMNGASKAKRILFESGELNIGIEKLTESHAALIEFKTPNAYQNNALILKPSGNQIAVTQQDLTRFEIKTEDYVLSLSGKNAVLSNTPISPDLPTMYKVKFTLKENNFVLLQSSGKILLEVSILIKKGNSYIDIKPEDIGISLYSYGICIGESRISGKDKISLSVPNIYPGTYTLKMEAVVKGIVYTSQEIINVKFNN